MPKVLTREQCGLTAPNVAHLTFARPGDLVGVTVHCTVTPTIDPLATWREIQREYMTGNNVNHAVYGDLPYNAGVTLDGRILAGRDDFYVGAHALSKGNIANRSTVGIALIGVGDVITQPAKDALRAAIGLVQIKLGHAPLLFDHFDWKALGGISTACPDPPTARFVAQLRAERRA